MTYEEDLDDFLTKNTLRQWTIITSNNIGAIDPNWETSKTIITSPSLSSEWLVHSTQFYSISYQIIAWNSGYVKFADWTYYNLDSNAFTLIWSSPNYIYLDTDVSTTTYQITTTPWTAVWEHKVLLCVAKANSDTTKACIFQKFWWDWVSVFITADNIAANSITANMITANAIDGKTITGALIQTVWAANDWAKLWIIDWTWWLHLWWNSIRFYEDFQQYYSWFISCWANTMIVSSRWYSWVYDRELRMEANKDIIIRPWSWFACRPYSSWDVSLWASNRYWSSTYSEYYQFRDTSSYMYFSSAPSTGSWWLTPNIFFNWNNVWIVANHLASTSWYLDIWWRLFATFPDPYTVWKYYLRTI